MQCWARYLLILVVTALGLLSLGSACGRKGPLYLPEPSPEKAKTDQADVPQGPVPQPTLESEQP